MNVRLVATQLLTESTRNRELPSVAATFFVAFAIVGLVAGWLGGSASIGLSGLLVGAAALSVPLFGLQLGYGTIAPRRVDGRLRLVLAQPVSRRTLVAGSYVAKVVVLAVAIVAGVAGALVGHAITGDPRVPAFLARFVLATLLLGVAYVGLSVGTSAAGRTTRWGNFTIVGCYLLFLGPWRILPYVAVALANGMAFPPTFPAWADLVAGLSPSVAFERLFGFYGYRFFTASAYTSRGFSVAVLLGWSLLPPALGLWRFVRTDL